MKLKRIQFSYTIFRKKIKDIFSIYTFVKKGKKLILSNPYTISVKQQIIKNTFQNLQIISSKIEKVEIKPKQIFSFWRIVGNPKKIKEQMEIEDFWQISSIIYHCSLTSGLQVLERHHHSMDIFIQTEGAIPLGTDAIVSYENKDLRIRNNYKFPIAFTFKITSDYIECILISKKEIIPKKIEIKETKYKNRKEVFTRINKRTVAVSSYKTI